jgi:DNA-binding MarR family transcriptional regulator
LISKFLPDARLVDRMHTEPTPPIRSRDPVEEAVRHWRAHHPETERFRALTSLVRAYSVALREVEALLRPLDLNLSRFEILLVLSFTRRGVLPISRLKEALMIHGSSVTYLVDRLEHSGLVARGTDEDDRRVVRVQLTDAGRATIEQACELLCENEFGVFTTLSEDRLEVMSDLLNELRGESGGRTDSE